MTTKFILNEFEHAIYINVIEKTFPKLIQKHKNLLNHYFYGLVQFIASSYEFYNNSDKFQKKLRQNNFKDLRWLLTYLIPYIDQSKKTMSDIEDLNDLYSLRYDKIPNTVREKVINNKIEDINFIEPKYVFSNLQYGRCDRTDNVYKSIKFNERHIYDNYYLLLDTIKTSRYKLYINWIDILPYRIDNFFNSRLYTKTKNKLIDENYAYWDPIEEYPVDKIKDTETIKQLNYKIEGLNIEDIYDTMSLDLYEVILPYKWMIFDVNAIIDNEIFTLTLLQIFNKLMELSNCLLNHDWIMLTVDEKEKFISNWDLLLLVFEKNGTMSGFNIQIDSDAINIIVTSVIVFFDRKYSKIEQVKKNDIKKYIPLERDNMFRKDIDDYEEKRMKDIKRESVIKTAKSIRDIDIYNFLRESLQGFKTTWYSKYLMNDNKTEIIDNQQGYQYITKNLKLTFKNVYNFCKSFVHEKRPTKKENNEEESKQIGGAADDQFEQKNNDDDDDDDNDNDDDDEKWYSEEYIRLPNTWSALNKKSQNIITKRLNNQYNNFKSWFNISSNLFFILKGIDKNLIGQYNNPSTRQIIDDNMILIYDKIRDVLVDIIFEVMIMRGTLSYMIAENELTNNSIYDMAIDVQKRNFIKEIAKERFYDGNPYAKNSYYYLTNKPFDQTGIYYIEMNGKKKYYDYFKFGSEIDTAWYIATAYHWVAQIGFCHRFINNRINYVTGATGAGKSTQVPKMYMYFLKAIDHINAPTVIITVPRTDPATNLSNFVAQELAVPYEVINETNDKIVKNLNFYVQYQHMKDKHVKNIAIPKLRFITDGSLLQDVKDPLMKHKRIKNDQYIYSRNNKYDVIIIDEAHEHNANMDMILTLMKNSIFYNNKLKLVIMSATMDADEPIYRRFYRDINDNRKYPLNNWIKEHNLDRINTERRFHISPPDQTTRFKIDEHYRPGKDPNDIVIDIVKSTSIGNILLFQPGSAEIMDSVNTLNAQEILPNNVIALPYYAKMSDNVRNFIKNIMKNIKNGIIDIKTNKDIDFSNLLTVDSLKKGDNRYDRVIIVATNIAEASVTIRPLSFVVDTGIEKTMVFDFERRADILKTNFITEASRLQRKGRVGRVSSGTVYYTYEKGSLENQKKQFNIAIQDIHQSVMLNMIRDLNDVPIFTELINNIVSGLNIMHLKKKYLNDMIKQNYIKMYNNINSNVNDQTIKYIDCIIDIINDHYITNGYLYDYYGNDEHYDYKNNKSPPKIYFSGFDIDQLIDNKGEFYIIHPDELVINRNIGGDIVSADQYAVITKDIPNSIFKKQMISNKIIVFWETLINMGFIGVNIQKQLFKTKLGSLLQYCISNITLQFQDISLMNVLFYGYGLSINDEEFEKVLSIVAMLEKIKITMANLMDIEKLKIISLINPKYVRFAKQRMKVLIKGVYGNQLINSDIDLINEICLTIDSLILSHGGQYNFFKSNYFNYDKFENMDIKGIEFGMPKDLEKGEESMKRDMRLNKIFENHKNDLMAIFPKFYTLLNNTGLSTISIAHYIILRENIRRKWNDLINNIGNIGDRKELNIKNLRSILKNHRKYMNELDINLPKGAFMLSYAYNIMKKISNTSSSYMALYNPHPDTIMTLPPFNTFIDSPFQQDYVLCLAQNIEYGSMNTLIQITKNDLMFLANIYNKSEMTRKFSTKMIDSPKLYLHIDKYIEITYPKNNFIEQNKLDNIDFRIYSVPEHINSLINIKKTVEQAKPDIVYIQQSKIWNILAAMDISYANYGKILREII